MVDGVRLPPFLVLAVSGFKCFGRVSQRDCRAPRAGFGYYRSVSVVFRLCVALDISAVNDGWQAYCEKSCAAIDIRAVIEYNYRGRIRGQIEAGNGG